MIFRRQVVERMRLKLYGDVILTTSPSFWLVAIFLVAVLAIAIGFSAVSKFARIEPVRGVISPSEGVAEVRAASSGFLSGFGLQIGDGVTAGQQIGQVTTNRAITGDGTRLAAELDRLDTRIENLLEKIQQTNILTSLQIDGLNQEELRVSGRIAQLHTLLALRKDAAEETRLSFDRKSVLRTRQLVSEGDLSSDRLRVIAADQQVVEIEGQISELTAKVSEFSHKRTEIDAQNRLTILQIELEIDGLEAERRVLLSNQSFAVISPVDGKVSSVFVRDGHEVLQGDVLARLLPVKYDLQAELYVPSRAIGFVKEGFIVRMNIDAFPYQEFGNIEGKIVEITTTVLQPNAASLSLPVQEPVFRVTVELSADNMKVDGTPEPLQVGMALTGNIILEERTLLSHVAEPLLSVLGRYR